MRAVFASVSLMALALSACTSMGDTSSSAAVARADTAVPAAAPRPASLDELASEVNLPYDKFTLDNGLTVVVHEDRKAPLVGVSVWYDVGSKHEPVGKTGFAHLFEHLMFNGTENAPEDW